MSSSNNLQGSLRALMQDAEALSSRNAVTVSDKTRTLVATNDDKNTVQETIKKHLHKIVVFATNVTLKNGVINEELVKALETTAEKAEKDFSVEQLIFQDAKGLSPLLLKKLLSLRPSSRPTWVEVTLFSPDLASLRVNFKPDNPDQKAKPKNKLVIAQQNDQKEITPLVSKFLDVISAEPFEATLVLQDYTYPSIALPLPRSSNVSSIIIESIQIIPKVCGQLAQLGDEKLYPNLTALECNNLSYIKPETQGEFLSAIFHLTKLQSLSLHGFGYDSITSKNINELNEYFNNCNLRSLDLTESNRDFISSMCEAALWNNITLQDIQTKTQIQKEEEEKDCYRKDYRMDSMLDAIIWRNTHSESLRREKEEVEKNIKALVEVKTFDQRQCDAFVKTAAFIIERGFALASTPYPIPKTQHTAFFESVLNAPIDAYKRMLSLSENAIEQKNEDEVNSNVTSVFIKLVWSYYQKYKEIERTNTNTHRIFLQWQEKDFIPKVQQLAVSYFQWQRERLIQAIKKEYQGREKKDWHESVQTFFDKITQPNISTKSFYLSACNFYNAISGSWWGSNHRKLLKDKYLQPMLDAVRKLYTVEEFHGISLSECLIDSDLTLPAPKNEEEIKRQQPSILAEEKKKEQVEAKEVKQPQSTAAAVALATQPSSSSAVAVNTTSPSAPLEGDVAAQIEEEQPGVVASSSSSAVAYITTNTTSIQGELEGVADPLPSAPPARQVEGVAEQIEGQPSVAAVAIPTNSLSSSSITQEPEVKGLLSTSTSSVSTFLTVMNSLPASASSNLSAASSSAPPSSSSTSASSSAVTSSLPPKPLSASSNSSAVSSSPPLSNSTSASSENDSKGKKVTSGKSSHRRQLVYS